MLAKKYNIIWSPRALETFGKNLEYLEHEWNDQVIETFLDATDHLLNIIASSPKGYPIIHKKKKIRKCNVVKQLSLIYRIKNNNVELISFFNNYQDPDKLRSIIRETK